MIKLKLIIAGLALILLTAGHSAAEKITICGTGDSQELLKILAPVFEKAHPGTTIDVPDTIGSSGGIKATAEGQCDIGRVARPLKEKELSYNLTYRLFANTPIVFVANPEKTGAKNLTYEQMVGIYSGAITKWSQLGGADSKIYVADRQDGDSSRTVIEKIVPGFRDIANRSGKALYNTPEIVDTVIKYPGTIGFIPLAMVKGTKLITMSVNGTQPTKENVLNGKYPLIVPLALVYKSDIPGQGKNFIDFLFTGEAQAIMLENGAVPAGK